MDINDRELLALTLQAEAGNQGLDGMMAAGSVIMNRANTSGYGNGLRGVILKPGQFSAWNSLTGYAGGEQGQDMTKMRASDDAYRAADDLIAGGYEDVTGGATHFYNPAISQPNWGQKAGGDWKRIGDHVFGSANPKSGLLTTNGEANNMALRLENITPPAINGQQTSPQQGGLGGLLSSLKDKAMAVDPQTGMTGFQKFASALDPLIMPSMRGGEGIREAGAQRVSKQQMNKTVEWLRKNGQNEIADAVEGNPGMASSVMQALLQNKLTPPKDSRPSLIQSYEYFKSLGLSDKDAMAQVRSGPTINTGDIGTGDKIYGTKAGLPVGWQLDIPTGRAGVIPGGPADIESAASAEAKDIKKRDAYEKDLTFFGAGERILRSIDEKTLIPATGTVAAVVGAIPGLGQFQKNVQEDFAQLQAQMQMAALQNLRETSQNGSSGLGQLTDAERTAIGKVKYNLTNLKGEAEAGASVKSAMLLKAYFEGGLFDPSINGYRVASESELSAMVNGINPFGNPEGPKITSDFSQFLPKYVAPQEDAPVKLTPQQLMEKYN